MNQKSIPQLFPYPGGKTKNKEIILKRLIEMIGKRPTEYRESCFGGGSIGCSLLPNDYIDSIWINDKDTSLAAIWNEVIKTPEHLKGLIRSYKPKMSDFYNFKNDLLTKPAAEIKDVALAKIASHRMGYSGMGTKGGVRKDVLARWNAKRMCETIDELRIIFKSVNVKYNSCTSIDLVELVNRKSSKQCVIYIDPPYFKQGNALYQYGFSEYDHCRLAAALKSCRHKWLLSYDDCSFIRELYSWAYIDKLPVTYSGGRKVSTSELLITHIIIFVFDRYTGKFNVFVIIGYVTMRTEPAHGFLTLSRNFKQINYYEIKM